MKYALLMMVCLLVTGEARAERLLCDALATDAAYVDNKSMYKLIDGKEGWVFRTKTDFREKYGLKEESLALLQQLNAAYAAQRTILILSIIPNRGMTDGDKAIGAVFDRTAAWQSYRDVVGKLRGAGLAVASVEDTGTSAFYHKRDHHWAPSGAREMAKAVAKVAASLGAALPSKKYVTEKQGTVDHRGSFNKLVEKVCGKALPSEAVDNFVTYAPADEDDLMGDSAKPSVILLGTSNSMRRTSQSNFDGFLKEALGADVENRAVSGGGADQAMLEWLALREASDPAPRLIVWEFPIYGNYHKPEFLREAIAGVHAAFTHPAAR